MITITTKKINFINQSEYDSIIFNLSMHSIQCSCGHTGCLVHHGYYYRTVKNKKGSVVLRILRVKCKECGRTHAILLSSIVPYVQIRLEDQVDIIKIYLNHQSYDEILNEHEYIDENHIGRLIRVFCKHWWERIKSVGISLSHTMTKDCFQYYKRQFMQIKCTCNILFIQPT